MEEKLTQDKPKTGGDYSMSGTKFSFSHGLINAVYTLIIFIVLPDLIFTVLTSYFPQLELGLTRAVGVTTVGAFVTVMSFCRGAFPRNSVVWALAGIAISLFSAAYTYILLGTPASYNVSMGGQTTIITFDISLLALLISIVISLSSLNNLVELSIARRKKTETERVAATKIAA